MKDDPLTWNEIILVVRNKANTGPAFASNDLVMALCSHARVCLQATVTGDAKVTALAAKMLEAVLAVEVE